MGSFVSLGSSTFGLGLCYNTHIVLLRLLKEDPNETLFKILLASFSYLYLYKKKADNIDNTCTIKDKSVLCINRSESLS